MPKGPCRPLAKISFWPAAAPFSLGRSTRTRPAPVSATKMSPLGAVRSRRGPERPLANGLTSKPAGTLSWAPAGARTTLTVLPADGDA